MLEEMMILFLLASGIYTVVLYKISNCIFASQLCIGLIISHGLYAMSSYAT